MESDCKICENELKSDEGYYRCDFCMDKCHEECVKLSPTEERVMPLKKRILMLVCDECKVVIKKMSTMIEAFDDMKKNMDEIKDYMIKSVNVNERRSENNGMINNVTNYSKMVAKPKKDKLIVKPAEKTNHDLVKQDVVNKINPVVLKTNISMGKNIKDGGVILECDKQKNSKIKEDIQKTLGEKYVVSEPKKNVPKLKIVNIPKHVDCKKEDLEEKIIVQNRLDNTKENFKLNIVYTSKEINKRYNIVVETDLETFNIPTYK